VELRAGAGDLGSGSGAWLAAIGAGGWTGVELLLSWRNRF